MYTGLERTSQALHLARIALASSPAGDPIAVHAARVSRWLRLTRIASGEGALPGDVAADDERLDLRGALVGDKRLRVA